VTRTAPAIATGSVALLAGSAREFQRASTTVHPLHPDKASTLVTTGPNRFTRNPMYVGMAGLLAAHAVARGGAWPWLPVAGFVAVIDVVQIRPEERALRSLFGVEYDAYRRTTRRWV
jgi:protein-S-isoprenylcysteine O-methyltransferase Ste14